MKIFKKVSGSHRNAKEKVPIAIVIINTELLRLDVLGDILRLILGDLFDDCLEI